MEKRSLRRQLHAAAQDPLGVQAQNYTVGITLETGSGQYSDLIRLLPVATQAIRESGLLGAANFSTQVVPFSSAETMVSTTQAHLKGSILPLWVGVLGCLYSSNSMTVAPTIAMYGAPQLSSSAELSELSNKIVFPNFM